MTVTDTQTATQTEAEATLRNAHAARAAAEAAGPTTIHKRVRRADEAPRNLSRLRMPDVFRLLGAAAAAIATTAWLFTQALAIGGVLPFILITYALFLVYYIVLIWFDDSGPAVKDRIASVFMHSLGFLLLFALAVVVLFTFGRGWEALPHVNFFTQDMANAGPLDPLSEGGILHAVAGTLIQISIALAISIPLGLLCAVFLTELPGPFARFVRTIVEAMTALPSIVAGLFIYATVILILGFDKSGFAASLAITVMMLPIIIRAADVVLRLVPGSLKEASKAMGVGQWRTVWHVVLPTARSGLTTAIILGTARGIGETSPVLLTAGFTQFMNLNPFSGPMVSLPLATFNFVKSPELFQISRGFGTAVVLMVLVLALFAIARVIGGRGVGQLTAGQRRRRAGRSERDARRFAAEEAKRTIQTTGYAGMGFASSPAPTKETR